MRDLGPNAVQLENAKCGCERWEIETATGTGARTRGRTCLHDENCALVAPPADADEPDKESHTSGKGKGTRASRSKKA